ncbi:MAG: phage terminase large subunit [Patescibacteria group bacterium]|nr:phage terminase large subunit [Patescibacteria group bacterium]
MARTELLEEARTLLSRLPSVDPAGLLNLRAQQTQISAEKLILEASLPDFFRAAWEVLEPGRALNWSWHYSLICEYLELARSGKFHQHFPEAAGLIVNVPPRTAKSKLLTVAYPVWCWLKDPARRFLCASYSADLSRDHSVLRRDLMRSRWFQDRWGHLFGFKADVNQAEHFANSKTGEMIATSVGGTATGQGGDELIVDDPINPDQAASDADRKRANDWLDSTLKTRLNNPAAGLIILVMQRLHELDPTGKLLAEGADKWLHVKIPLECEERTVYRFPVSGREFSREPGDVLQPDRFPPRVVSRLKMQRLVWAGQYQQEPAPLEGNLIKRAEVKYYGGIDPRTGEHDPALPARFDFTLISADCAFKDLKTSDFVAVGAIGVKGPNRYILKISNAHLDEPATAKEIKAQRTLFGASTVLVEDKANGPAVIKTLRTEVPGIVAIEPEGGKIARMFAAAGEWQGGNWFVDRTAAWTEPFIAQICNFPNAAHDDMADMMSQASVWLQHFGGGLVGLWKRQAEEEKAKGAQGPPDAKELADSQKQQSGADFMTTPGRLGKVVTAKEQPDVCPKCGNKFLSKFSNLVKCGGCGWNETTK